MTSVNESNAYQRGLEEGKQKADAAYKERNQLVRVLTKIFPAYLSRHDEEDTQWDPEWKWIVYVKIPVMVSGPMIPGNTSRIVWKQVSWHIHNSEKYLFNHLEIKKNNWDGHTTEEKYRRLKAIAPLQDKTLSWMKLAVAVVIGFLIAIATGAEAQQASTALTVTITAEVPCNEVNCPEMTPEQKAEVTGAQPESSIWERVVEWIQKLIT